MDYKNVWYKNVSKFLMFVNNLKIGMIYGFFVEAFKLGS